MNVGILYENSDWLESLFRRLDARRVPYLALDARDDSFSLDDAPDCAVLFNRVSPSSYLRDHGGAVPYALALLEAAVARGVRVIHGAGAFRVETSKVAQHLLLDELGLQTPRTLVFNGAAVLDRASEFPFPAILKPDMGGSGALVRRVTDLNHLAAVLDQEPDLFAPGRLLLLQEEVRTEDHSVVRVEMIAGEPVYAMRVRATNTFNLCPARGCERPPIDADRETPSVEFRHEPDLPPAVLEEARAVLVAAELDVGGVEFFETSRGRVYYDVNATSVYRREIERAAGVDGTDRLARFLARERQRALRSRRRVHRKREFV